MSQDTQNIGVGTSIVIDNFPVTFQASFNSTTLSLEVESCKLDLVKTVGDRFNDLNVILPEGSGSLSIAKFSGAISKTDRQKKRSISGEYRLINFEGELEKITLPIPIISDISIDKAFFYYQYLSANSAKSQSGFKDQIIFLGCSLSIKQGTKLSESLNNAVVKAAYFLSNNVSLIYFDFSGNINVGKIIEGIFGISTTNLTIDIQSAGLFRIAKTDAQKTIPGKQEVPDMTVPEVTYLDALGQIAGLQNKSAGPTDDSSVKKYMPSTFPLEEKEVTENGIKVTKVGIKVGEEIDTDFSTQFSKAFSGDNVTGICFWAMINFNQISLFNSLITIGYQGNDINSLILYGFKTQLKKTNDSTPQPPTTSAYFYAQLPAITLLDFLTFGGLDGRQGILFKYTTNNEQYELNGSILFTAFDKLFMFGGDLVVNNAQLIATLSLTVDSQNNSIAEPLGMTGVNFAELYLCINKTFAQKATATLPEVVAKLDLAIGGFIDFDFSGTKLELQGNIVFEDKQARLVLVSLNATPALTLNNFVQGVIKESWEWDDDITKQIGFISGTMYYLSVPESEKGNKDYSFTYANPLQVNPPNGGDSSPAVPIPNALTVFRPGYNIQAELLLFEKYVFEIDLSVQDAGITLSGTYGGTYENGKINTTTTITAFFISVEAPELLISTVGGSSFTIAIKNLKLFNEDMGKFSATYGSGIFKGSYNHSSPNFGFEWQWTKKQGSGGFSITKINEIDAKELDAITAFAQKLNSLTGRGGCESVVNSLFGEMKSTFAPALQEGKSPKDNGDGTMNTPLAINYEFMVGGMSITKGSIAIDLNVTIPKSLSGLPVAIIETLVSNMGSIIGQMLSNPDFYKAFALQMAKQGGAKLAARMLCRAAEEVAKELAESLAEALAEGAISAGLEALLELGAVLTGVLAAGIAGAIGGLLGILKKVWDSIKKAFGGDDGKDEAQDKLNAIKGPVQQLMSSLNASLNHMATKIKVDSLNAGLDNQGNYTLNWNFPTPSADLTGNGTLTYQLKFLDGAIGTPGTPSPIPSVGFELMRATSYTKAWDTMQKADPDFSMNATIETSITGYVFMTADAERNLQSTINTLNEIGDSLDGAVEFNNELKNFVGKMKGYNLTGLTSGVVYATQGAQDSQFRIGQSALGINTRIT